MINTFYRSTKSYRRICLYLHYSILQSTSYCYDDMCHQSNYRHATGFKFFKQNITKTARKYISQYVYISIQNFSLYQALRYVVYFQNSMTNCIHLNTTYKISMTVFSLQALSILNSICSIFTICLKSPYYPCSVFKMIRTIFNCFIQ